MLSLSFFMTREKAADACERGRFTFSSFCGSTPTAEAAGFLAPEWRSSGVGLRSATAEAGPASPAAEEDFSSGLAAEEACCERRAAESSAGDVSRADGANTEPAAEAAADAADAAALEDELWSSRELLLLPVVATAVET